MDALINRIIEIEKQSTLEIERAEADFRMRIEAHRLALEEEKERAHADVISTENDRLTAAIESLNRKSREAFLTAGRDYESRFQDPAKIQAVKEKIVAILLAG